MIFRSDFTGSKESVYFDVSIHSPKHTLYESTFSPTLTDIGYHLSLSLFFNFGNLIDQRVADILYKRQVLCIFSLVNHMVSVSTYLGHCAQIPLEGTVTGVNAMRLRSKNTLCRNSASVLNLGPGATVY